MSRNQDSLASFADPWLDPYHIEGAEAPGEQVLSRHARVTRGQKKAYLVKAIVVSLILMATVLSGGAWGITRDDISARFGKKGLGASSRAG